MYTVSSKYKWLVTGAAGFIGCNLTRELLKQEQYVVGLDNCSTGYLSNIDSILSSVGSKQAKNFTFIEGDIRSLDTCQKASSGVDYILHQAALGSVTRSIKDPWLTHENNVQGFLNIITAAKEQKVKRFIYASSSSVYGDSPYLPKCEDQIGSPLSPYAVSKHMNEQYAKAWYHCYNVESIGLRYFNVFGPYQNYKSEYSAVIPRWITALLHNQSPIIFGDGESSRDFCFVTNVIQANIKAALTSNNYAIGQTYNIASGRQTTLRQLFTMIACHLGIDKIKPSYQEFRLGDVCHSLANISKAQTNLNYYPTHDVNQGIKLTVDWYKYLFKENDCL